MSSLLINQILELQDEIQSHKKQLKELSEQPLSELNERLSSIDFERLTKSVEAIESVAQNIHQIDKTLLDFEKRFTALQNEAIERITAEREKVEHTLLESSLKRLKNGDTQEIESVVEVEATKQGFGKIIAVALIAFVAGIALMKSGLM